MIGVMAMFIIFWSKMALRAFSIPSSDAAQDEPLQTIEVLTELEWSQIQDLVTHTLPNNASLSTVNAYTYMKLLPKQLFAASYRKQLTAQNRFTTIRRILHACVVRQVIINEARPLPSNEELRRMPFFEDPQYAPAAEDEISSLRRFYRAVQTLVDIGVPGNNNKQTYIEVGAMLDGSNRTYAFGGAPSKATLRRQVIFHMVTGSPLRDSPRTRKRTRMETSRQLHSADNEFTWQDNLISHLLQCEEDYNSQDKHIRVNDDEIESS
jgi:hypothetical protein